MKSIILCADDYGQNTAISQAIIELIKKNRLSAVSCMTTSNHWGVQSRWLKPLKKSVDIGLHFNLTEGQPASEIFKKKYGKKFFPLSILLMRAHLRLLNVDILIAELDAQLDLFINELGCLPDFIDGHQHVHQFPVIRDAILLVYQKRLRENGSYVRNISEGLKSNTAFFKKMILKLTGALHFKKLLLHHQIPHNKSFSGIYSFNKAKEFAHIFPEFLRKIEHNGLIMCHPALPISEEKDAISNARHLEYQYFLSDQFVRDCEAQHIKLVRFSQSE